MKISVLTPTADRPVAFALCEAMMRRQTIQPDEWIVADGGQSPADCTMGQVHVHEPRPPGAENFAHNLLNAINAGFTGDLVIVMEDDDYYAPQHIERMVALAVNNPSALVLGAQDRQHYYNAARRCWRLFQNGSASMCQTAIRASVLDAFRRVVVASLARKSFTIDRSLWQAIARTKWALGRNATVLGIKGLPGTTGLGIGHRPSTGWTADPNLSKLRSWIGDDAETYAGFRR